MKSARERDGDAGIRRGLGRMSGLRTLQEVSAPTKLAALFEGDGRQTGESEGQRGAYSHRSAGGRPHSTGELLFSVMFCGGYTGMRARMHTCASELPLDGLWITSVDTGPRRVFYYCI